MPTHSERHTDIMKLIGAFHDLHKLPCKWLPLQTNSKTTNFKAYHNFQTWRSSIIFVQPTTWRKDRIPFCDYHNKIFSVLSHNSLA